METSMTAEVGQQKELTGPYRQCLFCTSDFELGVRDDGNGGKHGIVSGPDMLLVEIEQDYKYELRELFRKRMEHFNRMEPRIQEHVQRRHERNSEYQIQRLQRLGLTDTDASTAGCAIAERDYKKPITAGEVVNKYHELEWLLTFRELYRRCSVPADLYSLEPRGPKAHYDCAINYLPLRVACARSLALLNMCEFEMPAPELVTILEKSPSFKWYAQAIGPEKKLLEDRVVQVKVTKATGHAANSA